MHQSNLEKAESILSNWLQHENEVPKDPRRPRHPEFVYRKSGDWTSWNNFLSIPETAEIFTKNEEADVLENLAWQLYIQRFSH